MVVQVLANQICLAREFGSGFVLIALVFRSAVKEFIEELGDSFDTGELDSKASNGFDEGEEVVVEGFDGYQLANGKLLGKYKETAPPK